MALTYTPNDSLNSDCLDFLLPGVDGKTHSLADYVNKKPLLIMFICNHCPYVQAIEDRLIQLAHDLKKLGVNTLAISSNDSTKYAEDSFENMKKRALEKKYSFPYLHDDSQEVAKKFGAVCTPDFFIYDKNLKLKYRGRLDDSWKDADKVTKRELFDFVNMMIEYDNINKSNLNDQTTEHSLAAFKQTPSMGCSIKWK